MTASREDALLAAIRRVLAAPNARVAVGIGDDAAVVRPGTGETVLSADMLVEDVHFDRGLISPRDLGYKAVVVNVSDIAAMGASPRYALAALGLPADIEHSSVMELFGGMRAACEEYALQLVGGDLSRSAKAIVSITVIGESPYGRAITRAGARPGQRLVVTWALGAAAGGLSLARTRPAGVLGSAWSHALLDAQFRPAARVGEGQTLAQSGATSMMDISDGLSLDLSRLCTASDVGARIELAAVPVADALRELATHTGDDPLELALRGGEDYELLATLDEDSVEEARGLLDERFGVPLADIGAITEERGLVAVDAEGNEQPLEPAGWDHFAGD